MEAYEPLPDTLRAPIREWASAKAKADELMYILKNMITNTFISFDSFMACSVEIKQEIASAILAAYDYMAYISNVNEIENEAQMKSRSTSMARVNRYFIKISKAAYNREPPSKRKSSGTPIKQSAEEDEPETKTSAEEEPANAVSQSPVSEMTTEVYEVTGVPVVRSQRPRIIPPVLDLATALAIMHINPRQVPEAIPVEDDEEEESDEEESGDENFQSVASEANTEQASEQASEQSSDPRDLTVATMEEPNRRTRNHTFGGHNGYQYGTSEVFSTPVKTIQIAINIINKVLVDKDPVVFDPCYGHGAIAKCMADQGMHCIERDLYHHPDHQDFLDKSIQLPDCDVMVINPPFKLKVEFLKRAIDTDTPFLMLMPVTTICRKFFLQIVADGLKYRVFPVYPNSLFIHRGAEVDVGCLIWILGNTHKLPENANVFDGSIPMGF